MASLPPAYFYRQNSICYVQEVMLADSAAISAGENEIHGSRTVESLCTTTGRRMAMRTGILRTPLYQLFWRNSTTYSDSGGDLGLQARKIPDAYFQYRITQATHQLN